MRSYIDIVMGSFGVCLYWHNGAEVNLRLFDFYHELSRPTSRQHLTFRLMRSLRDMLLQLKTTSIRSSQIRIVYSGECSVIEPVHTARKFDTPTRITAELQKKIVREIMSEHADSVSGDYSVCGYVLHGISSRGFQYDEDDRLVDATFHGVIAFCDKVLRAWVERTLYLAGADVLPIRHRAQSSMIPSVLLETLLIKSKGSVLVYEFGSIQSLSSQWNQQGLIATDISFINSESLLHTHGQAALIEDIVSWCTEPKGTTEVIFLMDAMYYNMLSTELDNVMHKVQHIVPHYNLGAMVYALDYSNPEDIYRLFATVYDDAVVDVK